MSDNSIKRLPEDPKIIFMGTPEFAIPTLEALVHGGYKILSVITQPDRPKGRGKKILASPVKQLAIEKKIEVLQPERVSEISFCEIVKEKTPDLIIVVAFGQILSGNLLAIPKYGAINIHASLLPKYRGAAPVQRAILNNESQTGLSVIYMDEGLDTGPIIYQEVVKIFEDETAGQLHDRLALKAGNLIVKVLKEMVAGTINERMQDNSNASYAPKIERSMGLINWTQDAVSISLLIRALDPRPGAFTTIGDKKIKLFSSKVLDESRVDLVPGRIINDSAGGLKVETGKGLIEIREVQYPGKKRIPSRDFLRGFPLPEYTVFGVTTGHGD